MVWRPQWKLLPKLTCFFIRQNSDSRPSPHGINLHLNERAYRIRLYMNIDESKWINFYTKNVKLAKLNYESFLFDGSSVVWSSFWGGFFSTIFFAVLVRNPTIRFFHTFLIFWFWESCDVEWSGVGMLSKSEYNAHMGPETRISANRIEQFVREHAMLYEVMWKFGTRNEKRNYVLRSVGGLLISMNFRFISYSYLMELIFPDGLLFFVGRQIV